MKERIGVPAPPAAPVRTASAAPAASPAPVRAVVPIPAAPKAQPETSKQPPNNVTPRELPKPKAWTKPMVGDGADDVIDIGICPLCEEILRLAYPDAVDVGGHIVHAACAAKAVEQPQGD